MSFVCLTDCLEPPVAILFKRDCPPIFSYDLYKRHKFQAINSESTCMTLETPPPPPGRAQASSLNLPSPSSSSTAAQILVCASLIILSKRPRILQASIMTISALQRVPSKSGLMVQCRHEVFACFSLKCEHTRRSLHYAPVTSCPGLMTASLPFQSPVMQEVQSSNQNFSKLQRKPLT